MPSGSPSSFDRRTSNLDLRLRPENHGHVAELSSPAGELRYSVQLPLSRRMLENAQGKDASDRAQHLGALLFNSLFPDNAKKLLQVSIDHARSDESLRIRVHLAEAPELLDLPLEYLYEEKLGGFLFHSDRLSLVRYFPPPQAVQGLVVAPPVRMLAVVSSQPQLAVSNVDRELQPLIDLLRNPNTRDLMTFDQLINPTFSELQKQLQKGHYHILHFVGDYVEGFIPQGQNRQIGLLAKENFEWMLRDRPPLLLTINASAAASYPGSSPLTIMASSLMRGGISCILTMQRQMEKMNEGIFFREFYSVLLQTGSVDAAVTRARRAIATVGPGIDWGKPVLYSRSPDGVIFDLEQVQEAEVILPNEPPPEPPKSESTDPKLEALQTRLKELGFYSGEVDGTLGESTRAAVTAFQKSRGLFADGLPGPQTLNALETAENAPDATAVDSTAGDAEEANAAESSVAADDEPQVAPLTSSADLEILKEVRASPTKYVGSTDEAGLHRMVEKVIDSSIDEAVAGFCDTISLVIHADNSVTVIDNGRGFPVEVILEDGKTPAQLALTRLSTVLMNYPAQPDQLDEVESRDVSLAVVNFLSEHFYLVIWRDGRTHAQEYARGVAMAPLAQIGTTRQRGKQISFRPDAQIFDLVEFKFDWLDEQLDERALMNQGLRLSIKDERGESEHFLEYYYKDPVGVLVKRLSENKFAERLKAIRLLGKLQDKKATAPLLEILRRETSPRQRITPRELESSLLKEEIARALGQIGDRKSRSQLARLTKDETPEVRRAAAEALRSFNDDRTVNALFRMLHDDSDPENRKTAARVIAELRGPRQGSGLLLELLRSELEEVALAAAQALDYDKSSRNHSVWRKLINDDKPAVRRAVVETLPRVGEPEASAWLIELLEKDPRSEMQQLAAIALGELGGEQAVEALQKALKNAVGATDPAVAGTAWASLRKLGISEGDVESKPTDSVVFDPTNVDALIIGISNYRDPKLRLKTTAQDARRFHEVLVDPKLCGFTSRRVHLLLDRKATSAAIRKKLAELAAQTNKDASVLIYFGGHGANFQTSPALALIPADFPAVIKSDLNEAITGRELTAFLSALAPRRALVVLDCTYSGLFEAGPNWSVLASARGDEMAFESAGESFTSQLTAALRGEVNSDDGLIRILDLYEYIQPRVTHAFPNQHPILKTYANDNFPVALRLGGQPSPGDSTEGFRYDAYVSFFNEGRDAAYVRDELIPRLTQAGLRVVFSHDVEQGQQGYRAVNVHRAITQSRRTVLVLSPSFLKHEPEGLESALRTIGLESSKQRVLPLELESIRSELPDWEPEKIFKTGEDVDRLIEELKKPLSVPESTYSPTHHWALRQIDAWLQIGWPRTCLLTGSAASGKSTLARHIEMLSKATDDRESYPQLRPENLSTLFLDRNDFNQSASPLALVEQLAMQMAAHHGPFAEALAGIAERSMRIGIRTDQKKDEPYRSVTMLNLSELTPTEAFDLALRQPLQEYYLTDEVTTLIIVDGIDEATDEALTLLRTSEDLPPKVRFLVTSRPDPRVLESFPLFQINLDAAFVKGQLDRLSDAAKEVFLWAEAFRQAKQTPELFSEYLLAGLYRTSDDAVRRILTLFEDDEIIRPQLERFANQMSESVVPFEQVRPVAPEALDKMPLSPAAQLALGKAAELATAKGQFVELDRDAQIDVRDLLAGLLMEPTNQAGKWIAETLQVPRETLGQMIDETPRDSDPPLSRIWRASTRRPLVLQLEGHESSVTAVAFSPDGQILYSGDAEGVLRVWDAETGALFSKSEEYAKGSRRRPELLSVEKILAVGENVLVGWRDGRVEVFSRGLNQKINGMDTDSGPNRGLASMAVAPDQTIVIGHQDGTLSIWMAEVRDKLRTLEGHSGPVNDVAISPDGRWIVSVSDDETLKVWVLSSTSLWNSVNLGAGFTSVLITSDGHTAVAGAPDGTLTMWTLPNGPRSELGAHKHPIADLALIDAGRQLITISEGGKLRAWDLDTREQVLIADRGHRLGFKALAVAPDGRTLATGSTDNLVRLWDRATLVPAPAMRPTTNSYVMTINVSPAGEVSVGQRVSFEINLVPARPESKEGFELGSDVTRLSCFIGADDGGFRINGSEAVEIRRDEETGQFTSAKFELQAYLRGSRSYSVQLFAEDSSSGKMRIYEKTGQIIKVAPPRAGEVRQPLPTAVEVRVAPQPDLVLQIETDLPEGEAGPREVTYRLSSRVPSLLTRNREVGRVVLPPGELDLIRALLRSALQPPGGLQPEDARERLLSFGTYLFDRLFPADQAAEFRDVFWQVAKDATTWLFVEDGVTWLPWGLLVPYRKDELEPLRFLEERFHLSHWVDLGPGLYSEVPFGEIALAHYKALQPGQQDEELAAWGLLLNAGSAGGIAEIVNQQRPFYRLHLLRHAEDIGRQGLVPREGNVIASAADDAKRARLDLRLKRPVVSLSILDDSGAQSELKQDWPLPDRVLPFLRAGASAVIGPWWPTSEAADRIFWFNFYDLLERRLPLGAAVWYARLMVERALPHLPDWLAYTLFGDPRALSYQPEQSEGYTTLERLYANKPLRLGQPCYFRASISSRPSFRYQERLVQADALPKDPMALFLVRGLQDAIPEPIEMKAVGRSTVEAIYQLTPQVAGKFTLIARLYDGEERLQSLQIPLVVEQA